MWHKSAFEPPLPPSCISMLLFNDSRPDLVHHWVTLATGDDIQKQSSKPGRLTATVAINPAQGLGLWEERGEHTSSTRSGTPGTSGFLSVWRFVSTRTLLSTESEAVMRAACSPQQRQRHHLTAGQLGRALHSSNLMTVRRRAWKRSRAADHSSSRTTVIRGCSGSAAAMRSDEKSPPLPHAALECGTNVRIIHKKHNKPAGGWSEIYNVQAQMSIPFLFHFFHSFMSFISFIFLLLHNGALCQPVDKGTAGLAKQVFLQRWSCCES